MPQQILRVLILRANIIIITVLGQVAVGSALCAVENVGIQFMCFDFFNYRISSPGSMILNIDFLIILEMPALPINFLIKVRNF